MLAILNQWVIANLRWGLFGRFGELHYLVLDMVG